MSKNRVFVLDYESVTPLGVGQEAIFESLNSNYMGGREVSSFSTEGLKNHGAAEAEQDLSRFYQDEPEHIQRIIAFDRKFELMFVNYKIFKNRLLEIFKDHDPKRAGVILGVGLDVSPIEKLEPYLEKYMDNPMNAFEKVLIEFNSKEEKALSVLQNPLDLSALYLAQELSLAAFQKTVITACTSSTQAITLGYKAISRSQADAVLVGGTDSIINLMAYVAFGKLGVISNSDKDPSLYCRPFDHSRDGTLVGEASGLCVLASEEFVRKHNLKPKFEILGFGNTLDGHKITSADPSGDGMRRALSMAIEMSGISPSDLDYVNLHGTATRLNDELELNSFMEVVGEAASNITVSSTKSRHGHAIAAAGIQEFNLLCSCMENDFVPGNMNLENPVIESGIDLPKANKNKPLTVGMTNNFAFGGVNTSIIVKKLSNYESSVE